ncbi:hypothetical protein B0O99DRAFT_323617 [Bisporella sp. PMI_857]|nr:hypothetical protein B0O99DRAFT_323617 [Bisporella sp. PMI_857]
MINTGGEAVLEVAEGTERTIVAAAAARTTNIRILEEIEIEAGIGRGRDRIEIGTGDVRKAEIATMTTIIGEEEKQEQRKPKRFQARLDLPGVEDVCVSESNSTYQLSGAMIHCGDHLTILMYWCSCIHLTGLKGSIPNFGIEFKDVSYKKNLTPKP